MSAHFEMVSTEDALRQWAMKFDQLADECTARGKADGIHYSVTLAPADAARLALLLFHAASGIETEGQDARRLGAEHESPTAESGDAHAAGQSPPLSQGDE